MRQTYIPGESTLNFLFYIGCIISLMLQLFLPYSMNFLRISFVTYILIDFNKS